MIVAILALAALILIFREKLMALFVSPVVRASDANIDPLSGAKWHFYLTGTTTATPSYTTSALSVEHAHPVVADSGGLFAPIYLDPTVTYRAILKSAAGTTIQDIDPYTIPDAGDVPFTQSGTGASQRTTEAKLRDLSVSLKDFGGVADDDGSSGTDNLAAFNAAIAALKAEAYDEGLYRGARRLYIPRGRYYFSDTLDVKGLTLIIEGDGVGQAGGNATFLRFAASKCGIRFQRYNTEGTGVEASPTEGADASAIRGVYLLGGGGASNADHSGIWARCRVRIEDVAVSGFAGHGIMVKATQGGGTSLEGNANQWRIDSATLFSNTKSGLFIEGADANAGVSIGVDCRSNGEWGIYDSSFLGNTHIAYHCDGNTSGELKADEATARVLFLGGYTETGGASNSIVPPSIILFSFNGVSTSGGGFVIDRSLSEIEIAAGLSVGGAVTCSPGGSVTPDTNGEVTFELTNNTTLTFKAKGSDGTVRSGTVTLS